MPLNRLKVARPSGALWPRFSQPSRNGNGVASVGLVGSGQGLRKCFCGTATRDELYACNRLTYFALGSWWLSQMIIIVENARR